MIRQTVEGGAAEGRRGAAERFAYATLDALSEHVAVLDARGAILAVNRAWREFADANSPAPASLSEGANYFAACASAIGEGAEYATRFATGLRAVIEGESEEFTLEYPCHSATQKRWFIARAKRFELDGEVRAVVTHTNITARRLVEEERERLLRSLESERSRLAYLFTHAPSFVAVLRGPQHVFELANPPYLELVGNRDVLGKSVREALPEIEGQGYFELLGEVFRTGRPHAGRGVRVLLRRESGEDEERFLDFVYQPMFDADGAVSGIFVHGVDVTDHKRAEDRARASEERYRTLFTSIDEGFGVAEVLFDASGRGVDHRFIELNPSFEKLTGIPVEAALSGRTVRELVPNIEEHWSETYGRVLSTGEPERFVSGSEALGRWFDVYVFRVGRPEEQKVAILFNNITDRRLAEERLREAYADLERRVEERTAELASTNETLRESEQRLKVALQTGNLGSWQLDLATLDLDSSPTCKANFGLLPDAAFTYQHLFAAIHPDDRARVRAAVEQAVAGRADYHAEYRASWPDGSIHWIVAHGRGIYDAEGVPLRMIGVTIDVTERRQAEELRRELLRRLVATQEEERRRISRELHDQMGQQLAALMIGLKTLNAESYGRQSALSTLRQFQGLTDQLSREVHTLAWELRPPALDDLGLRTALYNYVEEWAERSRIAVDFHSSGFEDVRLPFAHETALYRIAQEALTNVLKHSHADRVSVILERRADHVLVVVEDNGRGFDVEALAATQASGRNLGLLGMRERAELLGGTLNVEATPGVGTSIFVRIPVRMVVDGGEHQL